ncbi:MAG: hypothetical protein ISR84_06320 [Kiritimatiellales bacterium]|nr:hypothetical protein [Kiritimatiellales bacterium]
MKKLLLLITGMLLLTGTAMADCGTCEGDAKKAKGKATCEMKKGAAAADQAACEMEGAEKKMKQKKHEHMKQKKHEHMKQMGESKDKASEQAQQKRKKWWKLWGGEAEPEVE